jgi:tripartite-type tricarboxylate transporter receptor subunit TctC
MTFSSLPPAIGLARDGKARPLAITSATRSRLLPDVPTVGETLPGYESAQRYGIVAPARTPRAIIDQLNAALREALAADDVVARITHEGAEPTPGTPDEYAAAIVRDEAKWSKIVRDLGVKLE